MILIVILNNILIHCRVNHTNFFMRCPCSVTPQSLILFTLADICNEFNRANAEPSVSLLTHKWILGARKGILIIWGHYSIKIIYDVGRREKRSHKWMTPNMHATCSWTSFSREAPRRNVCFSSQLYLFLCSPRRVMEIRIFRMQPNKACQSRPKRKNDSDTSV